jgi:dTDP-4-amino-4,6-dideoxygalactose transaminase
VFYCLPPAGNTVRWAHGASDDKSIADLLSPYLPFYYQSGTAALAAALIVAKAIKPVDQPEVILPAYGCPDLISAALYAGLCPILADFEPDRPWMSIDHLECLMSENTVAIVAVNLLGISERHAQLKVISDKVGALLIEDSAQAFPGKSEPRIWQGDLVVLSFGRGKPVSLLGGGAVLCKDEKLSTQLLSATISDNDETLTGYRVKTALYNVMIKPRLFWFPASLPFLHLGETRFHPLMDIGGIGKVQKNLLSVNIEAYQARDLHAQRQISGMFRPFTQTYPEYCLDLTEVCDTHPERPLLRYPALLKGDMRNRVLSRLSRYGLGGSPMYPTVLTAIEGLDQILDSSLQYPNAVKFAANFMTLPTHDSVRSKDISLISDMLALELTAG